ncbi:hypothetical protein CVT24_011980 [Panaeolus cyanescens]|uniref:Uncharacterized protein n=1 Tax=Panaeolus cyanescens TaxID=181874 RepID=A0A409VYZ5_9AGAR|nr:hypothetical protein CVT24_011980 [Panaeolus cyanescens]
MQETNTVLSGSSVLQFFQEETFGSTDLDIYVSCSYARRLLRFMFENFELDDPASSEAAINLALWEGNPSTNSLTYNHADFSVAPQPAYVDSSIKAVLNFRYKGRVLQIISCASSPIDTILRFHSTVVMNIVTATHAYLPLREEAVLQPMDTMSVASWELWYMRGLWNAETSYNIFSSPRLRTPLVACDTKVLRVVRNVFERPTDDLDDDFVPMDNVVVDRLKYIFRSQFALV